MKRPVALRMIALSLVLALLAPLTALAEEIMLEDGLAVNDMAVFVEDAVPELSGGLLDIDLEDDLTETSTGDLTGASTVEVEETEVPEEAQESEALALVLGVKEKYALDAEAIGSGKKVTFRSSKKSVATVTSKGVIKGVKKGSATITCSVGGEAKAVYEVQVVAAPREVTLEKATIILGVEEYVTLTPEIPEGTHASFTWSANNKKIATVSKSGRITGRKVGSTTIIVRTQNDKKASVKVKIKKAPGKVKLSQTAASLEVGDALKLKATLPDNTYSKITWTSSDKKVAKVSSSGRVTALAAGTATVTATTFNGKTASCKVTVKSSADSNVKYRVLLIGEEYFRDQFTYDEMYCTRNRSDVTMMAKMLNSVRGLAGGSFSVTKKYSLSASQTLSAIKKTFAEADDDDVSLFFIASHGDVDKSGERAGMLEMSPSGTLLLKDLANALSAVPGKVIVILESCGSGAAVYAGGDDAASNGVRSADRKALFEAGKASSLSFDAAVVRAFADADSGGVQANSGEFRVKNKFYVLTASRYQELSWGWEDSDTPERSYNFFTKWLTEGVGTSGYMPADSNDNGQTTLDELYQYIVAVGDNYPITSGGQAYYQHVQVYPADSRFVLFCR